MHRVDLSPLFPSLPMASSPEELIRLGTDISAFKCYAMAMFTILAYEYVLLLPDEIEYAWSSKKALTFYLFLMNRYFPLAFLIWMLGVSVQPNLSQEAFSKLCKKTSFVSMLSFVVCTLLAQTVLTLRIHAITAKKKLVTLGFIMISFSQLVLGVYLTSFMAMHPAEALSTGIPYDAFRTCVFERHRTAEVAYTFISLGYDFLAFVVVAYVASKSTIHKYGFPSLVRTLARDATKYFLVIFTAHLVLAMTLLFASPSIQLTPATGNVVYLPVMIARLMISLKKASLSRHPTEWSMGASTIQQMEIPLQSKPHAPHANWGRPTVFNEIPLSRIPRLQEKGDCWKIGGHDRNEKQG